MTEFLAPSFYCCCIVSSSSRAAKMFFPSILLFSCVGMSILQEQSLHFSRRKFENQAFGRKISELQAVLGFLSCAAFCCQNNNCSFFSYDKGVCSAYSKEKILSDTEPSATNKPMFEVYQRIEKLIQDDYEELGSSGKYVKKHDDEVTWADALNACQAEGATLVKLDTRNLRSLYAKKFHFKHSSEDYIWIGLSDKYDNNTWYWTDGSPVGKTHNWKPGEPDNFKTGTKENCAITSWTIWIGVKWLDTSCNCRYNFVCERLNQS